MEQILNDSLYIIDLGEINTAQVLIWIKKKQEIKEFA